MAEISELPTLRLKVQEAARQMLLQGKLPTGRAIREIVGTGSMQTIYSELEFVARELGTQLSLPQPPDPLQLLFNELWTLAVKEADQRHAAALQEREAQVSELRQSVSVLETRLEGDRQAHEQSRQALETTLGEYREKLSQVTESLSRHQVGEAEALRQAEKLAFQLEEARNTAAAERAFFQQESTKAERRYEEALRSADLRYRALEDRVLAEADAAKVASKKALDAAEASHARLMAEAQKRLDDAVREMEHLRSEVGAGQKRLDQLANENTALQVALGSARGDLEGQKARNTLLEEHVALLRRLVEAPTQEKPEPGTD